MKKQLVAGIAALSVVGGIAFAAAGTSLPHPSVKQEEIKWMQPFGPTGPTVGLVEGTFGDNKPTSFFVKFTGGQESPWHFHNHPYEGITLKGTFTEQQKGEPVVQLPVGAWFVQPPKQVHQNTCLKGEDCLVFIHFDKGADSIITDESGKPVPPPKATASAK